MFEWWRRLAYARFEARIASTDYFEAFDHFASGPWSTELVKRMPRDVLLRGPQMGTIDAHTRRIIDLEIQRRDQLVPNSIAGLALLVSIGSLVVAIIALKGG